MDPTKHKVPGQHEFEGVQYASMYHDEILTRVKKEFELHADDVLIVSYPKSGRIWMEEIVWLLQNEANFTEAGKQNVRLRVPPIEIKVPGIEANIDKISRMKPPRILTSFLQYPYLARAIENANNKVIVLLRNSKDVMISYYHFYRMCSVLGNFTGTWDQFFTLVKNKGLSLGDWFDHVTSWWIPNNQKANFLFIHYEDLKQDAVTQIEAIATFLGKNYDKDTIEKIAKHTSFSEMSKNKTTNMEDIGAYKKEISKFMRLGQVGDWKQYFSEEQNSFVADMMESKLGKSGLQFKYEL